MATYNGHNEPLVPYHAVVDPRKVSGLAADMQKRGWQGAPLVRWDNYLITGVHRHAAAKKLGWEDSDIPTVPIEDVFGEAGLDFVQSHRNHGEPTVDDHGNLVDMLQELPHSLRTKYGIDLE